MGTTICWIQHSHKRIETEKNGGKDGKALYELMNNWKPMGQYDKPMGNLRNRINVKLVSNKSTT